MKLRPAMGKVQKGVTGQTYSELSDPSLGTSDGALVPGSVSKPRSSVCSASVCPGLMLKSWDTPIPATSSEKHDFNSHSLSPSSSTPTPSCLDRFMRGAKPPVSTGQNVAPSGTSEALTPLLQVP